MYELKNTDKKNPIILSMEISFPGPCSHARDAYIDVMRSNVKITSVKIKSISPLTVSRRSRKKFRVIEFEDLYDDTVYKLVVMNGHKGASRFEKLPTGTKLARVVVYSERGVNYVDGNSNFSVMRAQPLL